MEAQCEKMNGLNLNPLAPAQSKRTFPFSGKARNSIENASIPAPFFSPFLYLFRAFSRKVAKGVQGPDPEPEKDTKMRPKGVQMDSRGHKVKPQGTRKCKKSATCNPRGSKWSPRCNIGAQGPHKCKTHTHKKLTQITKKPTRRCPKESNKEEKPYDHKQPTNQRKKEGHKETNNRTNTHTHKSFELQTQTQTAAARCSPKAT